jgi:adenylate kinase family enzyme
VHRVRVVGTSGSGKTTFAGRLAGTLGVPHLELDAVFWDADWTFRDLAEAHALIRAFAADADGWVADGNWRNRLDGLLADADTIVWLDYPRRVVMWRVVRRTISRGLRRTELWHGNRENLANLLRLDADRNVVLWAWWSHVANRTLYEALERSSPVLVVRLRSPRRAERWLATLP